jgi:hypothetical protein
MPFNKKIALVVWNSEKENDAHVYLGAIIQRDNTFYFVNEEKKWKLRLDDNKLNDLKEVNDEVKEILLNAELFLTLTIAELPGTADEGYSPTGMKWHE